MKSQMKSQMKTEEEVDYLAEGFKDSKPEVLPVRPKKVRLVPSKLYKVYNPPHYAGCNFPLPPRRKILVERKKKLGAPKTSQKMKTKNYFKIPKKS
jgi:hypothetical protein